MKRTLIIIALTAIAVSCNLDGYSEYSLTSVSDFEFDINGYTDSIFVTAPFYGGSSSYATIFNSARPSDGAAMTGGFGLTIRCDTSLVLKDENLYPQYTVFDTAAARGSSGCAVFYQNPDESAMPDHDIYFYEADSGTCTPASCMINNTQLTVHNVLSDDSSVKFQSGDYLKLKITGMLNDSETGTIEYYLADYRGDGSKPDSVLTSWKTLSLSRLGNIEYIDFSLESTKGDIPWSFCLDNLISSIYIKY